MRANLKTVASLGLNTMTNDQCEEIHLATLEVLERTGVKIFHADVLGLLERQVPIWMVTSLVCRPTWSTRHCTRHPAV